jgi:hypothetical protein
VIGLAIREVSAANHQITGIDESAAIALEVFIRRKVFENIFKPNAHGNT